MVGETLRNLLMIAWLLPLAGFAVEIFGGFWGSRKSRVAAWMSVGCIATGFVCSFSALMIWGNSNNFWKVEHQSEHHAASGHEAEEHATGDHADAGHPDASHPEAAHALTPSAADSVVAGDTDSSTADTHHPPVVLGQTVYSGTLYYLARFGSLDISLDYYIDSLTLVMFTMVTFIATCIHLFAMGYMSEELTEEYVDQDRKSVV